MKTLLRKYIFLVVSLWFVQALIPGFTISGGITSYLSIGFVLALVNTFVKPLLKLVFLPINMMTLGLFTIVINAFILYAIALFFPEMSFSAWKLSETTFLGLSIPSMQFGIIASYLATALTLSVVATFLNKL